MLSKAVFSFAEPSSAQHMQTKSTVLSSLAEQECTQLFLNSIHEQSYVHYLVLMEYPCTQYVLRPKHTQSFLLLPQDLLLLSCQRLGSTKSSTKATEAPLPWSLSHCWFHSCRQVYKKPSTPRYLHHQYKGRWSPGEMGHDSLNPEHSFSSLCISSTPHFSLNFFHCFFLW